MTCRCSRWTAEQFRAYMWALADYVRTLSTGPAVQLDSDFARVVATIDALFADEGTEPASSPSQLRMAGIPIRLDPRMPTDQIRLECSDGQAVTLDLSAPPSVSGERPAEPVVVQFPPDLVDLIPCQKCGATASPETIAALRAENDRLRDERATGLQQFNDYVRRSGDDEKALRAELDRLRAEVASLRAERSFAQLRRANVARLPMFKNRNGGLAHAAPDGSDWCLGQWSNAVLGELGEAANLIKKVERGDYTLDQIRPDLGDELADVLTYLDLLAFRAGVDLGAAVADKWNRVSERVGLTMRFHQFAASGSGSAGGTDAE